LLLNGGDEELRQRPVAFVGLPQPQQFERGRVRGPETHRDWRACPGKRYPRLCINLVTGSKESVVLVGIQSFDRVNGTKPTKVMERVRVSLGAIFSITQGIGDGWRQRG
jgi:hypothetical protein